VPGKGKKGGIHFKEKGRSGGKDSHRRVRGSKGTFEDSTWRICGSGTVRDRTRCLEAHINLNGLTARKNT